MAIVSKDVINVRSLLEMPLAIPSYQRPYKWQAQHVSQLFEDVIQHRNKNSYRLGTIVLHQNTPESQEDKTQQFIVDGQQRLLTLTLLYALLDKKNLCKPHLLQQHFSSPITIQNLQHNAAVIDSRAKQLNEEDREELIDFLLNKCELICVTLNDLNEAFQFFDSQNARGKELEPHDLLKAFHLREMADNSEQERFDCVAAWESAISPDNKAPSLHLVMSDILFRIRQWSTVQPGSFFSCKHIRVFKGVSLGSTPYPFTESMRALDYMVTQYNVAPIRQWDQRHMPYPFSVDQTILNGKRFFEYIQHYIRVYQTLFIGEKPELQDLLDTIKQYEGRNRTGDRYVRNLFYCALLFYYDKFGNFELEKAARLCFVWSYRIRLLNARVAIETIDKAALKNDGLFNTIKRALHPQDVLTFALEPVKKPQQKGSNVDGLIKKFKSLGYYVG